MHQQNIIHLIENKKHKCIDTFKEYIIKDILSV